MIDLMKLIELIVNRKDKFRKAEERFNRKSDYFLEISEIDKDDSLSPHSKRAMKNAAAQKLSGSGLATFEVLDYYNRHPDFTNFEIVAPLVIYWDDVLIKAYDENSILTKLEINEIAFKKEKRNLNFSIIFISFVAIFFLVKGNTIIHFIANNFYINKGVIGAVILGLMVFFILLIIIFLILLMNLLDLRRLVR